MEFLVINGDGLKSHHFIAAAALSVAARSLGVSPVVMSKSLKLLGRGEDVTLAHGFKVAKIICVKNNK